MILPTAAFFLLLRELTLRIPALFADTSEHIRFYAYAVVGH